jgi:dGTPase
MEVAGISRDIARGLQLNEDLAECIALAHDLGHPPFGHAGEEALHVWMQSHGMHFEHNEQSYRIVDVLAEHGSLFRGLNLNKEVLEGLLKHRTPHDHPSHDSGLHAPSLEAQLVNIADEIAYTAHDCEDGLKASLFSLKEITAVPLAREAYDRAAHRGTSLRGSLIHLLVTDLYQETSAILLSQRITTLDDVYGASIPLVCFSDALRSSLDALRAFLWNHMYNNATVLRRSTVGQQIVHALCNAYEQAPNDKIIALQEKTGSALCEAVKDYVAGMTDHYAFSQAAQLGILPEGAEDALGHY